jgi:hypothetical protein
MSTTPITQAHITYEAIGDDGPEVIVIEFLSHEIPGPLQAHELAAQLEWLIRPDLPHNFVIDFANVKALGSTAFGVIADFVRGIVSSGIPLG